MSDLTDMLRGASEKALFCGDAVYELLDRAADEIERLEQQQTCCGAVKVIRVPAGTDASIDFSGVLRLVDSGTVTTKPFTTIRTPITKHGA